MAHAIRINGSSLHEMADKAVVVIGRLIAIPVQRLTWVVLVIPDAG